MRKQGVSLELGFTHHDIQRLKKAMKVAADKRYYLRLQAVLGIAQGMAATKICELIGSSLKSIYNYVNCYMRTHQVSSLWDAPRCGRPASASAITNSRIKAALQHNPLKLGYNTTGWTVAVLADYLHKKYQCSISNSTLRRRMKAMGLRFKRPRYVYVQKDPNRTQKKGLLSES